MHTPFLFSGWFKMKVDAVVHKVLRVLRRYSRSKHQLSLRNLVVTIRVNCHLQFRSCRPFLTEAVIYIARRPSKYTSRKRNPTLHVALGDWLHYLGWHESSVPKEIPNYQNGLLFFVACHIDENIRRCMAQAALIFSLRSSVFLNQEVKGIGG